MKQDEEIIDRETKLRSILAVQRVINKNRNKKRSVIDFEKCPLLSKPSKSYKNRNQLITNQEQTSLDSQFGSNSTTTFLPSLVINEENQSLKSESLKHEKEEEQLNEKVTANKSCLRNILNSNSTRNNKIYERLFLIEHLSDLFIAFTLPKSSKYMNHDEFVRFIK